MEEEKMEDEKKKLCIEDADPSTTQSSDTIPPPDTKSQIISPFCSQSSEDPKWSSVDTTTRDSSLNVHSGSSFTTSESQDSLNTLGERSYSLGGSKPLMTCADSSQPKTCSPDTTSTSEKVVDESEFSNSDKESFLKPDSSSNTNLPSATEISIPISPSGTPDCTDTFKSHFDSRPGAGSTDVSFKEIVSDNDSTSTKKRSFDQLSPPVKEVCGTSPDSQNIGPNPDSQHVVQNPPSKKFKPELHVGKESNDDDLSYNLRIPDSYMVKFSDFQQETSTSDSSQSLRKSAFVETDSCLEDAQQQYTCEAVSSGESAPLETQQTELDQVEDEYRSHDFSQAPKFLTYCSEAFQENNFLKGCKWAPDGSCILTNSDDRCLRLFNLPEQVYSSEISDVPPLEPVLKMQESGTIYDYCWFPGMTSAVPETCCLVSTSKDTPVHMWDAFTSELRCTYRSYDQMDEIAAAHSVAFSLDGQKIYCGFNKMIRIFDVERPGRQFTQRPTHSKKNGGQAGIISCIVPSPVDENLYATGSYSKEIALYVEPAGSMMCMFQGHQGGVTHLLFSPDGNRIYSGGRKDPEILCWDLRNPGTILFTLLRQTETNQRIYFDLDRSGRYMMSGNHDGTVTVWDTTSAPVVVNDVTDPLLYPCLTYPAHNDSTNGIGIHPSLPIVASASGQRHYSVFDDSGSEDETPQKKSTHTNDLRLWWFT